MAGKYSTYPKYKDSGVKWLGEIPITWQVSRIKFFSQLNPSKQAARELPFDTEVSFLPMEAIGEQGELDTSQSKRLGDLINGYTYVADGDVMIAKITPCFENGKGAIAEGLKSGVGFATTEVIPLRSVTIENNRFLYYLLSCPPFRLLAEGAMYGAGGQKRVNDSFVANYHFALPPDDEVRNIANFLDHETAKIDTLIDKQQQLIKLLKEKRQAVISHAVTKGLNPDVPMKDSGVEWFGEVPEHWDVTRLKYECRHIIDCMHSTPQYDADGVYPAIRTADISPGFLDVGGARRVSENVFHERNERLVPKPNDIIYSREGERYGMAALVPENSEVCLAQRVMLFRAKCPESASFLMWHLNSNAVYMQAYQDVIGATSPHINVETIKNFYMAWPPLNERQEIATYINSRLTRFDRLIQKAENKILLLQERRTALSSAAVTGKIDVRNWQPEQPSQPMEASA